MKVRDSQVNDMAEASPNTPMVQPCDAHWIEFRLVDKDDKPVPGEAYTVRLPDQSLMTGTLDDEGKVRFEGIVSGQASICFPGMHESEWQPL